MTISFHDPTLPHRVFACQSRQTGPATYESGCCLGLNEQMAHRKIGSVLFVLSEFQMYWMNVMVISFTDITIIISHYYLFYSIFIV